MKATNYITTELRTIDYPKICVDAIQEAEQAFALTFGHEATHIWIGSREWSDLISSQGILNSLFPSTDINQVYEGTLGTIFNLSIVSDAFDDPGTRELYNFNFQVYSNTHAINFMLGST